MRKVSARWCSLLLGASVIFGIPSAAWAQTTLTWAKVERLRNRVHIIPNGHSARPARVTDLMEVGDALRTAAAARAELRFNDGSLARVGEQATFRFSPNTRNFQLSNGTVLLLIPPGRGRTTIQTPNAVTGIQGSALFVRVRCLADLSAEGYCSSPITVVGALTNNPAGAMVAYTGSGSQQQPIYAGEMVTIEGDTITQRLEFDLSTFYQTSGLVEGLQLDSPTPPPELSEDLQGVWQEIQDALKLQGDFDSQGSAEEVVQNPSFIAPVGNALPSEDSGLDSDFTDVFASFPGFISSPAADFHGIGEQVATQQQPRGTYATTTSANAPADDGITPITSAVVGNSIGSDSSAAPSASVQPQPAVQPTAPGASLTPAPVPEVTAPEPTAPVATIVEPTVGTPAVSGPTVQPTPEVAPVATPPEIVPEVTTPVEVTTPEVTPVEVTTPEIVTPVEVATPTVPTQEIAPEPTAVTPTAPQPEIVEPTPGREAAPTEAFNWEQQQPTGAEQPEVFQTNEVVGGTELAPELNVQ
ncbi:MAG: FecR domain-containing protein [Cyanobacteria bacterium P01_H01_bin.26]